MNKLISVLLSIYSLFFCGCGENIIEKDFVYILDKHIQFKGNDTLSNVYNDFNKELTFNYFIINFGCDQVHKIYDTITYTKTIVTDKKSVVCRKNYEYIDLSDKIDGRIFTNNESFWFHNDSAEINNIKHFFSDKNFDSIIYTYKAIQGKASISYPN